MISIGNSPSVSHSVNRVGNCYRFKNSGSYGDSLLGALLVVAMVVIAIGVLMVVMLVRLLDANALWIIRF